LPAPVRHRQRNGRGIADPEAGDQWLGAVIDVDHQRLERHVPEDSVGHDHQLGEPGREIGPGTIQNIVQKLPGGLLPLRFGQLVEGHLAILLIMTHLP